MTLDRPAARSEKLAGQVAVVTGGGSGLGRAMALGLASAGASVAVVGRRPDPLHETVKSIEASGPAGHAISADLTNSAAAQRAMDEAQRELGPIDTLVNCAGLVRDQGGSAIWDLSDDDWRTGIEGILNPAFYCSRAVAQDMCDRGSGKIINISSGLGLRGARDNYMYACAKGAIIQLTRSLAMSLGRWGVTSNCVAPGFFPTEATDASPMALPTPRFIPIGRTGRAEELAPLIVWLASPASDYMTGEVLIIDGGGLAGGYAPTGHRADSA